MDLIDSITEGLQQKRDNLTKYNTFNCIPFSDKFPKLSNYLPGIIKGVYYITTAGTGVGKTQLAKYLFVRTPYDFIKKHPEANLKLKVLYFALEESKEEFINTMIVAWLAEEHNIFIDVLDLNSMLNPIDQEIIDKIKEGREYFKDLFDVVEVIDSVSNPYGMYKYCREYSDKNGTHYWTQLEKVKEEDRKFITHQEYENLGSNKKGWKYSHYKPFDENEYVIILSDHISLLTPEKDQNTGVPMSLHQTMSKWSVDYCRKQITKHWKYVIVNIQQQAAASEDIEHFKANKLEPSLAGMADNKLTSRDALVVLGLFAPDRYQLNKYLGYDITKFQDNFRSLLILKNRIGKPNLKLPLFFDGAVNTFKELPAPTDEERLNKVYRYMDKVRKK